MKVAIYARVSTHDQNCERQIKDLTEYAARCGYQVVGVWSETMSGMKVDRVQRKEVMKIARARDIDAVLVSELTRWGRSTIDLINTLNELHSWKVSLIAQNGFQCDLSTPHGKMILGIMATLAEFERDLFSERVKSGVALARSKGKVFGRKPGSKADKYRDEIKSLSEDGKSIRVIAKHLGISRNMVERQLEKTKKHLSA
ncbi:recombinase family protein [Chamaesiphon polymorphus]|uniref:DNA resolvase n=1 Tax=Chamaesiphon polymorphus CCALA 037 TaxID=2107692 RepID=A0A2T1GJ32_9CYAN|nr:recombinase family protein [Chamaesiphon polymorphus]PSB57751.1 DNA resolvase [Chamaesiphon polymorphus CCALA 037]